MKFPVILFLGILCFSIKPCRAQGCELVQKFEAKDGIGYMGAVDVSCSNSYTQNGIYSLFLGKTITKSDTSYTLNIGINAVEILNKSTAKGITFQFEDGSERVKSEQTVEVMDMAGDDAMLSAQVDLTVNEITELKTKRVVHIILATSKTIVPAALSTSIRKVAMCLPDAW